MLRRKVMQRAKSKEFIFDSSGLIFRRTNQNYFIVKYRDHFHLTLEFLISFGQFLMYSIYICIQCEVGTEFTMSLIIALRLRRPQKWQH